MNWISSTNAKEIVPHYLSVAIIAKLVGVIVFIVMRFELSSTGVPFILADHQLFNGILLAHAFEGILFNTVIILNIWLSTINLLCLFLLMMQYDSAYYFKARIIVINIKDLNF